MKTFFTPNAKFVFATIKKNFFTKLNKVPLLFITILGISLSANAGSITVGVAKKSYNGSDISCSSSADAQLTITASGGSSPYKYSIDNGSHFQSTNVFSNLSGGQNYIVVVKDSKGHTSDAKWIWVDQAPNRVTITNINKKYYFNGNNDVSCADAADGQISISAWGGTKSLTYSADGGETFQPSSTISGLAAGTYQIVVKDANGCMTTASVTLKAPSPVTGTIVAQTNTSCSGTNTGSVTIAGSGGVGFYFYSMDGKAFQWSGTFTNLSVGAHTVLIKDINGCMGSHTVNITSALTAVLAGDSNILKGSSANLSVAITGAAGATYKVIYKDNSGTKYTANNLVTGVNTINTGNLTSSKTYTLVSITSNTGCTGTVSGSANIIVFSNCQWLGLSSDWNDVANWLNNILPTAAYDIVIPATANDPIISQADAAVKNLTINAGATLTINGKKLTIGGKIMADTATIIADHGTVEYTGSAAQTIDDHTFKNNALHDLIVSNSSSTGLMLAGPLDLYGSLNFTGTGKKFLISDTLTLKSTATETAMVSNITGNSIIGKVTVERYVPGVKKAWRFMAVPTKPGQTIHDAWQEGQPASNTSLSAKGIQIQGNYSDWSARGFDGYAAAPVIKTYNSANDTWVGVNSLLTPFSNTVGGYMVFIRGDRSANVYNSPVTSTVLRTKGELYQGSQAAITVTPKQFIPVSNPYAAPLDLRKIDQSQNLFFYVWDPNLGSNYGGYQTLVKNASGNYIAVPGGGSYSATDNNLIQSGSAFFVFNNNGGNLTISENSKADINTTRVAFTPATVQDQQQELAVHLYSLDAAGNATIADGVLQDFDNTYSNNVDGMDAKKSVNTSENLSIKQNGQLLAFESKQTITADDTTFLNLANVKVQKYRFEISASNLASNGMQGFLEDNYLKTKTPLDMSGVTDYDFAMVNIAGAYAPDRFRIVFAPALILPVHITSITANQKGKDIAVEWKTEDQVNLKQYEIERSVDGNNFSKVATVAAAVSPVATYSWMDVNPAAGYNYYRIRSVDINGKASYTQVVKVQTGIIVNRDITVFPNPILNGTINLQLTNQPEGIYYVNVTNQLGQSILHKQIVHSEGSSSESIELNKNLAHGMYQVNVTTSRNDLKVIKVLY